MKRTTAIIIATMLLVVLASVTFAGPPRTCPANGKLKIFILSGQSNMVGFDQLAGDSPGTMETLLKSDPEAYGDLVDRDSKPVVRDDVWIVNLSYEEKTK